MTAFTKSFNTSDISISANVVSWIVSFSKDVIPLSNSSLFRASAVFTSKFEALCRIYGIPSVAFVIPFVLDTVICKT